MTRTGWFRSPRSGLNRSLHSVSNHPATASIIDTALTARAVLMIGRAHRCSCCGLRLRRFTQGGPLLKGKPNGYCPRCNSKPRHRFLWLWLAHHTPIFDFDADDRHLSVLHIAPARSTHRSFRKLGLSRYVTAGLDRNTRYDLRMDLGRPALTPGQFDLIVCVHVLEHVDDDVAAIAGLYELVAPGGTVVVGVPLRSDQPTAEDPSLTDPAGREAAFGEPDHRRWYGPDIVDRLTGPGFIVQSFLSDDEPPDLLNEYGIKPGEALFRCERPRHTENG